MPEVKAENASGEGDAAKVDDDAVNAVGDAAKDAEQVQAPDKIEERKEVPVVLDVHSKPSLKTNAKKFEVLRAV